MVIPLNIETIEHYAFYDNNNIKHVTITKNVKSIGSETFRYCDNLRSVYIFGTLVSEDASNPANNIYESGLKLGGAYSFSNGYNKKENGVSIRVSD